MDEWYIADLNISTRHRTVSGKKIELCLMKAVLKRTQMSGVKLTKTISYLRLKTQKHLVSIGLSYSGFSFYEHFNRQFTYAVFFYISFFGFLPCLGQLHFICNYIALKTQRKYKPPLTLQTWKVK